MCLLPCVSHEVWASSHQSPAVTDGEALSASLARPPLGGSGERLATSDCAHYCWLRQRLMVCCVTAGPARTSRTSRGPRSRWRKGTFAHLLPNLLAASISFGLFFYIIQMLGWYFELYFLEFVQPNAFAFCHHRVWKVIEDLLETPETKGTRFVFPLWHFQPSSRCVWRNIQCKVFSSILMTIICLIGSPRASWSPRSSWINGYTCEWMF